MEPASSSQQDRKIERPAPLSLETIADGLSLQFDHASANQTDREVAVPLTPQYKSFKKLEVVNSKRINLMTKVYNIVSLIALILSGSAVIVARTVFSQTYEFPSPAEDGVIINLRVYTFPKFFTIIDSVLSFIVFLYSIALLSLFSFIVLRRRRDDILNEQIWVIMLLVSAVLYLNPYEAVIRLLKDVAGKDISSNDDGFRYVDIFICLRLVSFSMIFLLYVWFGAHSYRFLQRRVAWRDWSFYLPKMIMIFNYVLYKLILLFRYDIVCSEVPFMSFIAFVNLYGTAKTWPKLGVITAAILTGIELFMTALIAVTIRHSFKTLAAADYTKHRTNILGFRFFLHQHLVFYTVYILTYIFLLFGLPIGVQILPFLLLYSKQPGRGSYFDVHYAPFGLNLCVLAFTTTEAYTNLPANVNVLDYFMPWRSIASILPEVPLKPVVYRNREPPSLPGESSRIEPNCFIMQTNIDLFNLSWFVYYYGTHKEANLNIDFTQINLKIRDCLYDPVTDTRAIVAETPDRIIFAFKGTSSGQNLATDLKVNQRSLASIIEPELYSSRECHESPTPSLQAIMNRNRGFRRARVHAGFAAAYQTIKHGVIGVTAALLREKERPVCFTGHSLGGALATLSSLDVQLTLRLDGERVAVSSFGSPRVGNEAFQQLYDDAIPTHWRFVAGGDLISRLPKVGYRHVGKKVILTSTGELFIDPSALEIIFWHSQSASIVHHRKACYLLALKSWCDSRGDYIPNLWPFPVSASDSRKFNNTFRKRNTQGITSRIKRQEFTEDRAERMQRYADAIDALGDISPSPMSVQSVHHWRRLGRAALNRLQQTSQLFTQEEQMLENE